MSPTLGTSEGAREDRPAATIRESGNLVERGCPTVGAKDAERSVVISSKASKPCAAISWSGGKDSCAALHRVREQFTVVSMVTMFDEQAERSRSHGLRPEVVAAQAERLGVSQFIGRCTWDTYTAVYQQLLNDVAKSGVTHVIFGDIMFDEHKRWAERLCEASGLTAVEPLWGESTDVLFDEWIASGDEAMIVTARAEFLDETWLGRNLSAAMAPDFIRLGVDKCGERGEYHTVVTNTSLFSRPLTLRRGAVVQHSGCWAMDFDVA